MKSLTNSLKIALFFVALIFISCERQEDYSHVVFKNYLSYEIDRSSVFLTTVVEGSAEGEYKSGAKQQYQEVIDASSVINENSSTSQSEIDAAYSNMLQAALDFYNRMNPLVSVSQRIIDYADYIYSTTEEGTSEGNVPEGAKAELKLAIDSAKQTIERPDLNQSMLDVTNEFLYAAITDFNNQIIGKASIAITNPGFEEPGFETDDFTQVPGWGLYGAIEDWMYPASIVQSDTAPDGNFVAKIGSYTTGIYQQLPELIQVNTSYDLSMKVALLSNNTDWQGDRYPVIFLTRYIVFEGSPGNYNFVRVVSEQYDTLGISQGGFVNIKHKVDIGNNTAFAGRKLAIDLIQRHTWNTQEPIYAESYVAIDNLTLTRE